MRTWRLDPIGSGRLAWLYLKARPEHWPDRIQGAHDAGYWLTGETQPLIDHEFHACQRYLCIRTNDEDSIPTRESFAQLSSSWGLT